MWLVVGLVGALALAALLAAAILFRAARRRSRRQVGPGFSFCRRCMWPALLSTELSPESSVRRDCEPASLCESLPALRAVQASANGVLGQAAGARPSSPSPSASSADGCCTVDSPQGSCSLPKDSPGLAGALRIRFGELGQLELGELIGRGGFGRVYRARWRGVLCAVKVGRWLLPDSRPSLRLAGTHNPDYA